MINNIFGNIYVSAAKEGAEATNKGLGLDLFQLAFYLVCFFIAMVVLNKFLFGPIGVILDEREKKVEASLDQVEELENKIANADNQAKSILSQAAAQSRQMIEDAKLEVEPAKTRVLQEAEESKRDIISGAHKDADKIVSTANATAEKEVVNLVQKAITKASANLNISDSTQNEIISGIISNKM